MGIAIHQRALHERHSVLRRWTLPVVIRLFILGIWLTFAAFVAYMVTSSRRECKTAQAYSPLQDSLHPELQVFDSKGRPDSPYAGIPSPAVDKAWTKLLQYSNVRFTQEEMDAIDPARKEQGIKLPDGGYFGTIHVIHELQCIKHLHRFLYRDHYLPDLSTAQVEDRRLHLEHCLDTLRQGIICRGDSSPITMRWGHKQAIPLANFSSPHSCVSWDSINDWTKERSIQNLFEPGYLRHPALGDVYAEDFENKIGIVHDE